MIRALYGRGVAALFHAYVRSGLLRRWCEYRRRREPESWPSPTPKNIGTTEDLLVKYSDACPPDGPPALWEALPTGRMLEANIRGAANFSENPGCCAFAQWAAESLDANDMPGAMLMLVLWVAPNDPWWKVRGHYIAVQHTVGASTREMMADYRYRFRLSGLLGNYAWAQDIGGSMIRLRLDTRPILWGLSNTGSFGPCFGVEDLAADVAGGRGHVVYGAAIDPFNLRHWRRFL